ncbi:hypothetical protein Y1Q_0013454 [Alligator mississippiensis]|uniref:Uncharacterized protein n=1 Tax=Alligator mississippiensis TaxID=8496 RepID=A0A151MSJ0_ALLMI|nr:hypothetical protein Y1Q_0013454 [Alligator mississippiensis]
MLQTITKSLSVLALQVQQLLTRGDALATTSDVVSRMVVPTAGTLLMHCLQQQGWTLLLDLVTIVEERLVDLWAWCTEDVVHERERDCEEQAYCARLLDLEERDTAPLERMVASQEWQASMAAWALGTTEEDHSVLDSILALVASMLVAT